MYYVHKFQVHLQNGGPEEGGWWYEVGIPATDWKAEKFSNEDAAYARCVQLNHDERERAKVEEDFEYHSVLAYKSHHFAYSVSNYPEATTYPERAPHYE